LETKGNTQNKGSKTKCTQWQYTISHQRHKRHSKCFQTIRPNNCIGIRSTATFGGAFGNQAKAATVNKLHHKIRKPARSIHIVPKVQHSLLSTSKLVEADYVAIYDKQEEYFCNATTTKIVVSEEAVLKGWQCPVTKLWRIPLVD
jgi:hypothetical protein